MSPWGGGRPAYNVFLRTQARSKHALRPASHGIDPRDAHQASGLYGIPWLRERVGRNLRSGPGHPARFASHIKPVLKSTDTIAMVRPPLSNKHLTVVALMLLALLHAVA